MTIREHYQELALRTLKPGLDFNGKLLTAGLGLVGEIAELDLIFAELDETRKGLGDIWWYVSVACHVCNMPFEQTVNECLDMLEETATHKTIDNLLHTQRVMLVEAGKIAETVKKTVLHEHPFDQACMKGSTRQLIFWLCDLCIMLGFSIDDILEANIAKLQRRYPTGFDPERSQNREENHARHHHP